MRRAVVALVLAAAALAASPAHASEEIAALVADLAEPQRRVAAMQELQRRKDPAAVPLLVRTVKEATEGIVRYYSFLILDAYPPRDLKPVYAALAREADPFVRAAAGAGLLRAGEREGIPVLAKALAAEGVPESERIWMLSRASGFAVPEIHDAIRRLLKPGESPSVLGMALGALTNAPAEPSEGVVGELLADPRPGVRAMAAAWLLRLGRTEHEAALAAALAEGEMDTPSFSRVESFLNSARRVGPAVLDAVLTLTRTTKETYVLQRAVEMLARHRHRAAMPRFEELLAHESDAVAKAAFEALIALSGSIDEAVLRKMLEAESKIRRLWAADALRRLDDPSGLPAVLEIAAKGTDAERLEAIRVLGDFRSLAALDALLDALSDRSQAVRAAAWPGVTRIFTAICPYRRFDWSTVPFDAAAPPGPLPPPLKRLRDALSIGK